MNSSVLILYVYMYVHVCIIKNLFCVLIHVLLLFLSCHQQLQFGHSSYSVRTDDGEAICSYIDEFQKHPEAALVCSVL